jgi:hypothetical protein
MIGGSVPVPVVGIAQITYYTGRLGRFGEVGEGRKAI